ncbi:MAG: stage II sporulation protein M [Fervidobacterium sp.]
MKYFRDIFEIIKKRSWKVYALLFGVFVLFFLIGFSGGGYMLENDPSMVEEFINEIKNTEIIQSFFDLMQKGEYFNIASLIFIHNSQVAVVNYVLGITFILPLLIELFNGMIIGFFFGVSPKVFVTFIDGAGFFIILVMEVIATTLTAVEGMYLTYSIIRPQIMWKTKSRLKSAKKTFRQSIKILLFALALLLISAIIETLLIHYLWVRNIQSVVIGI